LGYVSAWLALLSRPVKQMPQPNRAALTFASVAGLLNELPATPSGGAHEQYGVAAFLDGVGRTVPPQFYALKFVPRHSNLIVSV
jgi:hypothetical protein